MPVVDVPARIGRFVVERRLDSGGMADLFLARDPGAQRRVVVKRINVRLAVDERFVKLFQREAQLAARLHHDNIVRVLEIGEDGEDTFFVMEHVDGINAMEMARRAWGQSESEPLSLAVVLRVLADTALGLDHAHHLVDDVGAPTPLVHRDVAPDNLIVGVDGMTKICDFGIAKALGGASLTNPGEIKGKFAFMSPEHVQAQPVDGRADLWSLGVTGYWLVTGRLPFRGDTAVATMNAIVDLEPARPSSINATLSPQIDALLLGLLEKDADRRPARGQLVHDTIAGMLCPALDEGPARAGGRHAADVVTRFLRERAAGVEPPAAPRAPPHAAR